MKNLHKIAVSLASCIALHANASVITYKTGYSTTQSQASADAYRTVVDAAVQNPTSGYGTKQYTSYTVVNSFGANQNLAQETLVNFDVSANQAGSWTFRIGGDFGYGAAVFIDNKALTFSQNDMWWGESFSTPSQYLMGSTVLTSGNHTLAVYGLEGCCGGDQQGQFKIGAGQFTTFSNNDGLGGHVPEPGTLASILLGLGVLGGLHRRRAQRGR
jgi:hypothetical protein